MYASPSKSSPQGPNRGRATGAGRWLWLTRPLRLRHAMPATERHSWRMPPLALLKPVARSPGTKLGMLMLRRYLLISVLLLIVKAVQLRGAEPAARKPPHVAATSRRPRVGGINNMAILTMVVQPFVRALEHFTILPSPGSQAGEPSGEEPPGVWGSLDGHLPWETALREPSRLVQTGSRPNSHRGGHWFDTSIAHRCKARSEAPRTGLILCCGWELSPYWEQFGRSFSPPGRPGPRETARPARDLQRVRRGAARADG
jgi:hypothetical protein